MLSIPIKLLMTPEGAYKEDKLGQILLENKRLLQGDVMLAVYVMYEFNKGKDSFYWPFLNMLPKPGWSDVQLQKFEVIE